MGGKQSTARGLSAGQSPVTEIIRDAYRSGEITKAQELVKAACQETVSQAEKVRAELGGGGGSCATTESGEGSFCIEKPRL